MDRPNILWICTDQQRWDTLGCYGNRFSRTPNLDRLASEGCLFEKCYSQSPVCTPSRVSFLTGRYPRTARCRQNGQDLPSTEVPVTKLFADAGYICGLSGKLHLSACHSGICRSERRIDDGYRVFHWSHHPPADLWGDNNEYSSWLKQKGVSYESCLYSDSEYIRVGMPEEFHHTTWCFEKAIEFIGEYKNSGKPWLFSVNTFDPHHPFDAPAEYLERYLGALDEIPLPDYSREELDNKPVWQQIDHHGAYGGKGPNWEKMTKKDHRLVKASYYAMCDLIDAQVGRLVEELDREGLRENTIIVYTSDHGEMLGDHGIYWKGPYFYEPAIHVPLIINCPGTIVPQKYEGMVELTDLAPSLLDAAELPKYAGMQGKSFGSVLTGGEGNYTRNDVYCEYYNAMPWHQDNPPQMTMLRNEKYKVAAVHGCNQGELYDLAKDPVEKCNVWSNPDYASVKLDMFSRLIDRLAWTVDPLPERKADW